MQHADSTEAHRLRSALIDHLRRERLIESAAVEDAFRAVPRHLFVPDVSLERAYTDDAIPTKLRDGVPISSSSQPAIMAIMLEQLDARPEQRVLEIGAGTGYNAALLAQIVGDGGSVTTLDLDDDIVAEARAHLAATGFGRVTVVQGDGGAGWEAGAPYDRIILTVGAHDIFPAWWRQLAPGGRLVLPLMVGGSQLAVAFVPDEHGLTSVNVRPCGFMVLRGESCGPQQLALIGPERRMLLRMADVSRVESDGLFDALTGASRDLSTDLRLTPAEILGALAWLSLHAPGFCTVVARDDAGRAPLPAPLSLPADAEGRGAAGIAEGGSLALLGAGTSDDGSPQRAIIIRAYGPEVGLTERMLGALHAWDRAGRPPLEAVRIRAYPAAMPAPASRHGDVVIRKRWSTLVLSWPTVSGAHDRQ